MSYLKPIRFNMQFDNGGDKPDQIRSLEDLKNKLNVNDLYEYFSAGTLERWLEVHGYTKEAEEIRQLDKNDTGKALEGIFKTLGFDEDDDSDRIKNAINDYLLNRKIRERKQITKTVGTSVREKVKNEIQDYRKLKDEIIKNKEDFPKVKSLVKQLLRNYPDLFELDNMYFFDAMREKCPLAVCAALMYKLGRIFFFPPERKKDPNNCLPTERAFYKAFEKFADWKEIPPENHKNEGKNEDTWFYVGDYYIDEKDYLKEPNYKLGVHGWQDAVSKGHRVMILYCGDNVEIRLPNDRDHQRNGKDVKPFDIMDGFDFRILDPDGYEKDHDYIGYKLLYMEID